LLAANEPKIGSTTTDTSGVYSFDNLPTFTNYIVHVNDQKEILSGYWHSLGTIASNNHSQENAYGLRLGDGNPENHEAADFGYYIDPAGIGNRVWIDRDEDGVQDPRENGFERVIVTLTITYPDATILTLRDTSDARGYYGFENVLLDEDYKSGGGGANPSYELSVSTPTAFFTALVDANSNTEDQVDSDDHGGTNVIPLMGQNKISRKKIPGNEEPEASYDFGFYMDCDFPRVHYAITNGAVTNAGQTTDYFFEGEPQETPGVSLARHRKRQNRQRGVMRCREYCERGNWRYYYNPLDPDEYLFALKMRDNVTPIEYIELRTDTNLKDRYISDGTDATFVMSRDWFVRTEDDEPLLDAMGDPAKVSIRFYFPPEEFEKMVSDARDTAAVWGLTNLPTETDVVWFKKSKFKPNLDILADGGDLLPNDITTKRANATSSQGVNTADNTQHSSINVGNNKNHIQFDDITGFSGGTAVLHINRLALPVEFTAFNARVYDACNVNLDWRVATEINFSHYEVERSTDAKNFELIRRVKGRNLNDQTYNYQDENLRENTYYYRLKMMDVDGSFEYSKTIIVVMTCEAEKVSVFPNPIGESGNVLTLEFEDIAKDRTISVLLLDVLGKQWKEVEVKLEAGNSRVPLELSELPSGTYYLRFSNIKGRSQTLRFIRTKE